MQISLIPHSTSGRGMVPTRSMVAVNIVHARRGTFPKREISSDDGILGCLYITPKDHSEKETTGPQYSSYAVDIVKTKHSRGHRCLWTRTGKRGLYAILWGMYCTCLKFDRLQSYARRDGTVHVARAFSRLHIADSVIKLNGTSISGSEVLSGHSYATTYVRLHPPMSGPEATRCRRRND